MAEFGEWTPTKTEQPRSTGAYIVTDELGRIGEAVWYDSFKDWVQGMVHIYPTAWMPLPKPYKASK